MTFECIDLGRVGLTVFARATFVAFINNFEVVFAKVPASSDVGNEFKDGGFPSTSLANDKEGVVGIRGILLRLDNAFLERCHVAVYCNEQ